jgi:hypothetical protein
LQEVNLSETNSIVLRNKVPDVAASNIYGFLSRDTCVSSTHLKRPFGENRAYLHLEKPKLSKYSFQKLTQFSWETMCYIMQLLK